MGGVNEKKYKNEKASSESKKMIQEETSTSNSLRCTSDKSSSNANQEVSEPVKPIAFIANGLIKIRDLGGFEEYFPLEEYNYFVELLISNNSVARAFQ